MRTSFVATRVGFVFDLFLGYEVWCSYVVPAMRRGTQLVLHFFAHVHQSGGTWAQQPFMGVGRGEIGMRQIRFESTQGLNCINRKQNASSAEILSDRLYLNPVTG